MPITIVDSQVHIWGENTPERPWPKQDSENLAQRARAFQLADLAAEMRAAGVDRAVIVPPTWEGLRNDLALDAARRYPERYAVMGRIAVDNPKAPEQFAAWKQHPGMMGVRLGFHTTALKPLLTEGKADWLFAAAEKSDIPAMVLIPGDMAAFRKLAERYPGLKLILDHMGIPRGGKGDAAFTHIEELCALARFPNITVKLTSAPSYAVDPYPHRGLHPYLRRIYDSFGPKRLHWGSDLTRMPCSYALCVRMFTEELRWLTGEDLEWIMGRSICERLGWKLPDQPG
jgi:predicted TIM-barrel fold metal-dependent hydrolase